MTLISRIDCGTHVYIASDNQVNDSDGLKRQGQTACKSRIVPGSNIIIGVGGVIKSDGVVIIDEIIDQLKNAVNITLQVCTQTIDQVLNQVFGVTGGWDCSFMISLIANGGIENYTYLRSRVLTKLLQPHIVAKQINNIYIKDLNEAWGSLNLESLWYSEIRDYVIPGKPWVSNVDFNSNYMHFYKQLEVEDENEWYIFTKPYTLLYFEFLKRGLSCQNFQAITDGQWIEILQSMYLNAHKTYTELYKNEYDRAKPSSSIGECNHILKLEQSSQKTSLIFSEDPCPQMI